MSPWMRLLVPLPAFALIGILLWLQRRQAKAKAAEAEKAAKD